MCKHTIKSLRTASFMFDYYNKKLNKYFSPITHSTVHVAKLLPVFPNK